MGFAHKERNPSFIECPFSEKNCFRQTESVGHSILHGRFQHVNHVGKHVPATVLNQRDIQQERSQHGLLYQHH
jgi:hypothetical protein